MKECRFARDLGITVTKERLLTQEETICFSSIIPEPLSLNDTRYIRYILNPSDKPNGEFREIGVGYYTDGCDTYARVVYEIAGGSSAGIVPGDRLLIDGHFCTVLTPFLVISESYEMNCSF